jgi:copper transport protein
LFLHGLCVTFWVGSLLPLCASLRSSPADGELARFSRAAPYAVALLAGSGLWLAAVQLGRLDALWSTGYGRVLACKLVAVSVLLMLAAANRYRLVRTSRRTVRPLRISIGLELAVALAILALVALWRFTPPPRAVLAMSIPIHVHGERAMAQIEIEPGPARGASLLVLDGELQPLAAKEIRLVLVNPDAGIEPMRYPAVRVDRNLWRVEGLRIPVAGRWQLRIELLVGDFDKLTIEDSAVLPRMP